MTQNFTFHFFIFTLLFYKLGTANDLYESINELPNTVLHRNKYFDSRKVYAVEQEPMTAEKNNYSIPHILEEETQNEKSDAEVKFAFPDLFKETKQEIPKLDFTQIKILHIRNSIKDLKNDMANKSVSKNSLDIRKNEILKHLQSIHSKNSQLNNQLRNLQAELIGINIKKRKYRAICFF